MPYENLFPCLLKIYVRSFSCRSWKDKNFQGWCTFLIRFIVVHLKNVAWTNGIGWNLFCRFLGARNGRHVLVVFISDLRISSFECHNHTMGCFCGPSATRVQRRNKYIRRLKRHVLPIARCAGRIDLEFFGCSRWWDADKTSFLN